LSSTLHNGHLKPSWIGLRRLSNWLQICTDPVLTAILIQGITHWLNETEFDNTPFSEAYQQFCGMVGKALHWLCSWKQVFQGRVTTKWASLYSSITWTGNAILKVKTAPIGLRQS
jgi:hypothetical protein